ncbi:MAG: enoyl-CoA hydratase/isomerase family protein [Neisseriaceae bacterium]|nr:enoyl-CoA hydratase/isomerase family protein [Neisseriaceae bacterium]MBP6861438.1 enoyl-CoA hydratase/isomerase family protein [Neisseriaceae bacterium]
MYQFLEIERQAQVTHVWLNRPEVGNAFNAALIAELNQCFTELNHDDATRVVILGGRGKHFSAGADLNWMKAAGEADLATNLADAQALAQMLDSIARVNKPTIARVQGAAMGGGLGLAAACDVCVASENAVFATSEVRLGLTPATISPYVLRAMGARQAHRYFLTAERISAAKAQQIGLVHELAASPEVIDATVAELCDSLLAGGPVAQAAAKDLIFAVNHQDIDAPLLDHTAQRIATLRAGAEAKEGLSAFLNKRSPIWKAE